MNDCCRENMIKCITTFATLMPYHVQRGPFLFIFSPLPLSQLDSVPGQDAFTVSKFPKLLLLWDVAHSGSSCDSLDFLLQKSAESLERDFCFIWEVSTNISRSSDSIFPLCVPDWIIVNSAPIENETYQTKRQGTGTGTFLQSCSLVARSLWCMLGYVGWAWPTTRALSAPTDVA